MKIVTVTSQKARNYGAVLQAYALQKTLLRLGYENLLLDEEIKPSLKGRKRTLKVWLRDTVLLVLRKLHAKEAERFRENFREFQAKKLLMTDTYHSMQEVFDRPPQADCYLTGSDQVFALGNELVPLRYLEFGSETIPRVSYAASLGSYNMGEAELSYIGSRLSTFSGISMRERQGSEYLNERLGIEAQTHIDPVFLLSPEEWEELMPEKPRVEGGYILCFPLLGNRNTQNVLDALKKETGLPVVSIQTKFFKTIRADQYLFDATVPEFLQLIKNAKAVVTTSFHGTALSILFHRPVYSLVGPYKPERVQNLCSLLGLSERVVREADQDFPPLDMSYDGVDAVIGKEKQRALQYLASLSELC